MSYLVEAEDTGPIEGEDAIVTPPRPPHRRVSVSLVFTLTVLVGTVVAIYLGFPPRHHVLMQEAIAQHREAEPAWDLVAPPPAELRAWAIGVVGDKRVPLPAGTVTGARRIEVLNNSVAIIRYTVGGEAVTYAVQIAKSVGPDHSEKTDDELRAVTWVKGKFRCVLVGSDRTSERWLGAMR